MMDEPKGPADSIGHRDGPSTLGLSLETSLDESAAPAALANPAALAAPAGQSKYTVAKGDILFRIAQKSYGDGNRWRA